MPEDDLLQFRIKPKQKKEQKDWIRGLNPTYFSIGFYLLVPILLGVAVGSGLDNWLDKKPFFTLLFIFLGTVSSFYNLWKIIKEQK